MTGKSRQDQASEATVDTAKNTAEDTVQEKTKDTASDAIHVSQNPALETDKILSSENSLDKVIFYAFDEARQKLEQGNDVEPFTVVISGDDLYVESHPGATIIDCFNSARAAIELMQTLGDAYVFCYDGYVNLDEGARDALIAERAEKGEEIGEAFALFYSIGQEGDGSITFEDAIYGLGEAPSLYSSAIFDEGQLTSFDGSAFPDDLDEQFDEFLDMAMTDDIEQAVSAMLDD